MLDYKYKKFRGFVGEFIVIGEELGENVEMFRLINDLFDKGQLSKKDYIDFARYFFYSSLGDKKYKDYKIKR